MSATNYKIFGENGLITNLPLRYFKYTIVGVQGKSFKIKLYYEENPIQKLWMHLMDVDVEVYNVSDISLYHLTFTHNMSLCTLCVILFSFRFYNIWLTEVFSVDEAN